MTFKEMIRFTYGLLMGTSTPLLKPSKRFLLRTSVVDVDSELSFFLGGSGNAALLRKGDEALLVNTNQGEPAEKLRALVAERAAGARLKIALNSTLQDFSGSLALYPETEEIWVGKVRSATLRRHLSDEFYERALVIGEERRVAWAGETVVFLPVGPAATESDLLIYFEKRSVLLAGPLFSNFTHPLLHPEQGLVIENWLRVWSEVLERFKPKTILPCDGQPASLEEAQGFLRYLRDLTDPSIEFSQCRAMYDWPEIPSCSSLEENFDLLREKKKTFTTLN